MAKAITAEKVEIKSSEEGVVELNALQTWLAEKEPWFAGSLIAIGLTIFTVGIMLIIQFFF